MAKSPLWLVAPFLALLLVSCGGGGDKQSGAPTPEGSPTPVGAHPAEMALGQYIQTTLNAGYAGDCAVASPGADAGKFCSVLRGERDNQRAYAIGPVAAEGKSWVFLSGKDTQWSVTASKPITPDSLAVPGVPWPLSLGVDVVVVGADPCVNVRTGPSLSQPAVDCIKDGTVIKLASGPADGDGFTWWQVEGRTGWVAADYLRYPDAAQ